MNTNDVIEAYVADVMRRLPRKQRDEIGFELRGLLTETLAEKAETQGKPADDAMVLAMLREFGAPAEVAARYRPPGMVVIPADQTRSFVLTSLIGIVLQWALTLPRVFDGQQALGGWWLTWGLGAFWWPGFIAMFSLLGAWLQQKPLFKPKWRPRVVDPERIHRGATGFGLAWFAIGVAFMVCMPWTVGLLPDPFPKIFAFDPDFLRVRAWPVVPLWIAAFALEAIVFAKGRSTPLTQRLEIASSLAFIALLVWWLSAGDIFQAKATNEGARAGIGLVVLIIVVYLIVQIHRRRTRIRVPKLAG